MMRDYKLSDEFDLRGYWWLPGKDEDPEKVAGNLAFRPGEAPLLNLQGGFDVDIKRKWVKPIPIILGDSNGLLITLVSSVPTLTTFGLGEEYRAQESTIRSSRVYIGAHFEDIDSILFERVFVQIKHLSSWLWVTEAFDIEHDREQGSQTITMKRPKTIEFELKSGARVGFVYSSKGPNWNLYKGEVKAEVIPHFFYVPTTPMRDTDIRWEIRHFQNLLTLAVGDTCAIESMVGTRIPDEQTEEDRFVDQYLRRVSVIFPSLEAVGNSKDIHPQEMIFPYSEISDRLEEFMANWYSLSDDLRVVQNLYFSTRYHPHMLIENMFLQLVQSLEAYHRLRFETHVVDKKEYSRISRGLINNIPDGQYKELVKQAIDFGNRKTLYHSLIELADNYGRILTQTFGSDRDKFLRRVTKTRHYRTHFDPKGRHNILEGSELAHAYRILRIMMEVCFLVELGFEADDAQELMEAKAKYIF